MHKLKKKIIRSLKICKLDFNQDINFISSSKYMFIGNVGMTTEADEVALLDLFRKKSLSGLQFILLPPGKQYSFILFDSPLQCEEAINTLNGTWHFGRHICMAMVDSVPKINSFESNNKAEGLQLITDFVSEAEEINLLQTVNQQNYLHSGNVLEHHEVCHFGYRFQSGSNSIDKDNPLSEGLPDNVTSICKRFVSSGLMQELPDQLTINRYMPGQGTPLHIDTHRGFTDEIICLSIGSAFNMDFKRGENGISDSYTLHLPRRSLCIMKGPSRYLWSHGIACCKTDTVATTSGLTMMPHMERFLYTFRKVRKGECICKHKMLCDSYQSLSVTSSLVSVEKQHVWDVYENIAYHFSQTRHKPWPNVLKFVMSQQMGTTLLDIGCGNGKYLGQNEHIMEIGCDASAGLLDITHDKGSQVVQCNCLSLPFRDKMFDSIICIAVIHHLASQSRREFAVHEMVRVLKPGGEALVYVWAMEQRDKANNQISAYLKFNKKKMQHNFTVKNKDENIGFKGNDEDQNITTSLAQNENSVQSKPSNTIDLNSLKIHENGTEFSQQDLLVPWKLRQGKDVFNVNKEKTESYNVNDVEKRNNDTRKNRYIQVHDSQRSGKVENKVFHRFYHIFRKGELEELVNGISGLSVTESYYDEGNWCVKFKKI